MAETRIPRSQVCYCTNVHPGSSPEEILEQLDANDPRPYRKFDNPEYRIGLWLSASAATELDENPAALERFASELEARQIRVLTLNGFPQDNFHQPVVKHAVYEPNWASPSRLEFTLRIARLLAKLIPVNTRASISTLPIGWRDDLKSTADLDLAASNLASCARGLAQLAEQTGRCLTLDLEPEPGCVLDVAEDVLAFSAGPLDRALARHPDAAREHLGVCHDVCHSAVMREQQRYALSLYAKSGIRVNKVQVSSAIHAKLNPDSIAALSAFDEPRYLHQTTLLTPIGTRFFEDLSLALASPEIFHASEARVHFHVPIFLEGTKTLGPLGTTQPDITDAVRTARELFPDAIFELETYAWNVLPAEHQPESLAAGIAAELDWFEERFVDSSS